MSDDTKPTVVEAWLAVMADVQAVGKTGRNTQQNYSFRGIDAVVNAAGPATREHGVIVMPTVQEANYRDVEVGKNRTLMREVTVKVRYTIFGPRGDVLTIPNDPNFGTVYGESMDSGDKGTAKAMSVAYRIFLLQALMIPTDEPDPDTTSVERSARQAPGLEGATPDQVAEFHELVHQLGPDQRSSLKAWFAKNKVPKIEKASAVQAASAIAAARDLLPSGPLEPAPGVEQGAMV